MVTAWAICLAYIGVALGRNRYFHRHQLSHSFRRAIELWTSMAVTVYLTWSHGGFSRRVAIIMIINLIGIKQSAVFPDSRNCRSDPFRDHFLNRRCLFGKPVQSLSPYLPE
jgi:hypothetical protein